jgi:GTP-binding protein YchF
VGVISVPDNRLTKLAEIVQPQKVQAAIVEIVDIAGLVKGASKGEGLGNKFLGNIRETDAIIHVLRCFENENITHVENSIDPVRDKEIIDFELQLKDLESLDKKLDKVKRAARTGDKIANKELLVLEKVKTGIESALPVRAIDLSDDERKEYITPLQFLTDKPVLYVCNVDEASAVKGNSLVNSLKEAVKDESVEVLVLAVATEADIAELDDYEEKEMFLEELGLEEAGASRLIRTAYKLLNLQTYFTAGEKEVRAWTIHVGDKAPQAAGVIHTDFEKGFIRAEVIKYEDFIHYGSEAKVKEAGKLSVEGKEYVVKDGDMMNFRFNV